MKRDITINTGSSLLVIHINSYMNKCNRTCEGNYAFRLHRGTDASGLERARIYCNSWKCRVCGPENVKYLLERIIRESDSHGLTKFMTLTYSPDMNSSDKMPHKAIKRRWRLFAQHLRRQYDKNLKYLWFFELNGDGFPHLHVLCNTFIPVQRLSKAWNNSGGGPIVHISKIQNRIGCAIYLTKHLPEPDTPKGTRRYGCSQAIDLKIPRPHPTWHADPLLTSMSDVSLRHRIYRRAFDAHGHPVYCRAIRLPQSVRDI